METRITEVADGVHQLTTHVAEIGLGFNQYLIAGEEPMLFHTGMRGLFPLVSGAISNVLPVNTMRWVSFGHVEADECGSMNEFLAAAPDATVAQGMTGCMVSIADLADRPPAHLQTAKCSTSVATGCAGSTRHTCLMDGRRAFSSTRPPAPCSAVTSSPDGAHIRRPQLMTCSGRHWPLIPRPTSAHGRCGPTVARSCVSLPNST